MKKIKSKYVITQHARLRFVQRTSKKYNHLQKCQTVNCEVCDGLYLDSEKQVQKEFGLINTEIERRINLSEENRSYINNTSFMSWYYDKYGYDKRFQFLHHEEIVFVIVWDEGKKIVVTCVPSKTHLAGKSNKLKQKYNKILTKEEKLLQDES